MVIADYQNTDEKTLFLHDYLHQYDTNQHLNILGINYDELESVLFKTDFNLIKVTEFEEIENGVRFLIPNELLNEDGHYKDYWITAYTNYSNGMGNTTEHTIYIYVKYIGG